MAKESGIAAVMAVDDSGGSVRTISNDITDFSISTPRAMITSRRRGCRGLLT